MLKKDLKINSMRVKKFTDSTYFKSDKIRERGFIQKTTILDSFARTNAWIQSSNIHELREKWMDKASKL